MNQDASNRNGAGNTSSGSAESGYTEKFPPTSGRVMGSLAVLLCAALLAYAAFDGDQGLEASVAWAAAFAGIVSYAALLRPGVRVDSDALVLRNMIDTNVVPLASIDEVVVRQVLAVRADEKRYVSPAIGTSFLRTVRPRPHRGGGPAELTYPEYVRDRILHLADGARRRSGDADPPRVRRQWAWPEIAGLVVTGLGFLVAVIAG